MNAARVTSRRRRLLIRLDARHPRTGKETPARAATGEDRSAIA
jgi:hypothetical protein